MRLYTIYQFGYILKIQRAVTLLCSHLTSARTLHPIAWLLTL
nr:MAG TPA: hypothetical protein [Caudoviricetes sp.]